MRTRGRNVRVSLVFPFCCANTKPRLDLIGIDRIEHSRYERTSRASREAAHTAETTCCACIGITPSMVSHLFISEHAQRMTTRTSLCLGSCLTFDGLRLGLRGRPRRRLVVLRMMRMGRERSWMSWMRWVVVAISRMRRMRIVMMS